MQIIPILLISLKASFIPDPDGQFNQQSTFCVKSFNTLCRDLRNGKIEEEKKGKKCYCDKVAALVQDEAGVY